MGRECAVLKSAEVRIYVSKEVDEADEAKHRAHDGKKNDTYHLNKKKTKISVIFLFLNKRKFYKHIEAQTSFYHYVYATVRTRLQAAAKTVFALCVWAAKGGFPHECTNRILLAFATVLSTRYRQRDILSHGLFVCSLNHGNPICFHTVLA